MSPQESIGHYLVKSKLGEGGMGAVYRATDTKLNRDVAIKVLPDSFAQDADRLARFIREAQVLASLNHPNIAAIHGVEERAIVMELVEGQMLAGPLSVEEALPIVHQLIDALEYAHEKGVVHRDLKPANINVTPEGRVKVLDFGLAKAMATDTSAADPAVSPTLTMRATMAGMIIGTAGYMSPEQARGHEVDKRADIWSFGVIVHELLTGKRLFEGPTVSDSLAAVLMREPDLDVLPPRFRRLVQRCLVRDARQRLRDISGARLLLEESAAPPASAAAIPGSRLPWLVAAVLFAALGAVSFLRLSESPPEAPLIRFHINPPPKTAFGSLALSPNGKTLAFTTVGDQTQIWVRDLDSLSARALTGTEHAREVFWSPDSKSIGFEADNKLKRIDLAGGSPQPICAITQSRGAGSWSKDGTILFASLNGGIFSVPAGGGQPKIVLGLDSSARDAVMRFPVFLPGGRRFLFQLRSLDPAKTGVYAASLDSRDRIRLIADEINPEYAPGPDGGYLVLSRSENLVAIALNRNITSTSGEPTLLAEKVAGRTSGQTQNRHSASSNGNLVYLSGTAETAQLTWFDRSGKRLGGVGEASLQGQPRLSPDGTRVVASQTGVDSQIFVVDHARDVSTRLTFNGLRNSFAVWTPDGASIIYASTTTGASILRGASDLYRKAASGAGSEELLLHSDVQQYPTDTTPDGRYLLYTEADSATGLNIMALPLRPEAGKDASPFPVVRTAAGEQSAAISPDGKWIAYTSDESQGFQIYLRPFNPTAAANSEGKWQVSRDGGQFARWRGDGKELYYFSGDGRITAVSIQTSPQVLIGRGQELFSPQEVPIRFAVTADGQRFLIPAQQRGVEAPVTVVLNWTKGLKPKP